MQFSVNVISLLIIAQGLYQKVVVLQITNRIYVSGGYLS